MKNKNDFMDKLSDFLYELNYGDSLLVWISNILIAMCIVPLILGAIALIIYAIIKSPILMIPILIFASCLYMVIILDKHRRKNGKSGLIV